MGSPTQPESKSSIYRSVSSATRGLTLHGDRQGHAEPRICTPPLRELTPKTSLGYSVIEFAEEVLGVFLYPFSRAGARCITCDFGVTAIHLRLAHRFWFAPLTAVSAIILDAGFA